MTSRAITGPTPSVAASSSSEASRIRSMEPKAVASERAAVGPTCRMDSATSTRHSGWEVALASSSKSLTVLALGLDGCLALPLVQKYGTSSVSPGSAPAPRFCRSIFTSFSIPAERSKSWASEVSGGSAGSAGRVSATAASSPSASMSKAPRPAAWKTRSLS